MSQLYYYKAVSRDVTRTNYDVAQNSGHFGAHRKLMYGPKLKLRKAGASLFSEHGVLCICRGRYLLSYER